MNSVLDTYRIIDGCYSGEGVMYFIWILTGLPLASLLCAAFIAMRDGKVAPANAAARRARSASGITPLSKVTKGSDWSSETTVQILIGILSNPNDDGFRVTIRQFEGDKASPRSESEVWTLRRCRELLFVDKDSNPGEVGFIKGGSGNHQAVNSSD